MIILNLPRSINFKPENIIIAAIIPGLSEPSFNEMNSFLRPLVKELNSLWTDGFTIEYNGSTVTSYAALLGSVCDIPATYKLLVICLIMHALSVQNIFRQMSN